MPKKKYSGKLAKPIPLKAALEAARRDDLDRWLADEFGDRFKLLLKHYGISTDDNKNIYAGLVHLILCLATDHVPGFQVRAMGRPRKVSSRPRPVTRPWPSARAQLKFSLPRLMDGVKERCGLTGHITDKKALEIWIGELALKHNASQADVRRTVRYLQKILSEGRRTNSKK